jgi:lysophospholipase L1-like esterase
VPAPDPAETRYVALGSSFAAGPGIPPLADRGALRSTRNYAHQLAEALDLRLTDVTCSGATTADLRHRRQPTLTGARPPQIEAVAAGLVTITAGGNDVGYLGMLTSAALRGVLARRLPLPTALADRLRHSLEVPAPERFAEVQASLVALVEEIRRRAPAARVVLVDYLPVLGSHATPATVPLDGAQIAGGRQVADELAAATARAALTTGADLLAMSRLGVDHGVGAPRPWMGGMATGIAFTGGPVPFHPTLDGMTAVAEALAALLAA